MKRNDPRERARLDLLEKSSQLTIAHLRGRGAKFRREDVQLGEQVRLNRYTCLGSVVRLSGPHAEQTVWFEKRTRQSTFTFAGLQLTDPQPDRLPADGDVVIGTARTGTRGLYYSSWFALGAPIFIFLRVLQSGRLQDIELAERNSGIHLDDRLKLLARVLTQQADMEDLPAELRLHLLGRPSRTLDVIPSELTACELSNRR